MPHNCDMSEGYMLSKCLNSHCSETFRYFGQGQLSRVDFAEASKKSARSGKKFVISVRSKTYPIEHFWLCEQCAKTMAVELSDCGEVRLIPLAIFAGKADVLPVGQTQPMQQTQRVRKATAS